VKTNLDGSIGGLYIQMPYGYQQDLVADHSVILQRIAEDMISNGHHDWAATVTKDMISDFQWRRRKSQVLAISYDEHYRLEDTVMNLKADNDPYHIKSFHDDLMHQSAPDEREYHKLVSTVTNGKRPITKDLKQAKTLFILAIFFGICSAWFLSILLSCFGIAALYRYVTSQSKNSSTRQSLIQRIRARKRNNKKHQQPIQRPGAILETTSGWLCWQYDNDLATPRSLMDAANAQVQAYINDHYEADTVQIKNVNVSTDGRMIWFSSSRPLSSDCDMTPYEAEQYLSLYAKINESKERPSKLKEPMIITSTLDEDQLAGEVHVLGKVDHDEHSAVRASDLVDLRRTVQAELDELQDQSMALKQANGLDPASLSIVNAAYHLSISDIMSAKRSELTEIEAAAVHGSDSLRHIEDELAEHASRMVSEVAPLLTTADHDATIESPALSPINPFTDEQDNDDSDSDHRPDNA
jgi:hypothetical protein